MMPAKRVSFRPAAAPTLAAHTEFSQRDLLPLMFRSLGNAVVRFWPVILVGWIALAAATHFAAPPWLDVVENGEFAFLPDDSPSLQAESLFEKAFPDDLLASSVVLIVRRESHPEGLSKSDRTFIDETLRPALERLVVAHPLKSRDPADHSAAGEAVDPASRVRTFSDKAIGQLLDSRDKKASLVIVELPTEFLDTSNVPLINAIEKLIDRDRGELAIPAGLDIAASGSATVGRDMMVAAHESSSATELWTVLLVIALLIVIYRAPLLALIPLTTVAVSTHISVKALAILAGGDWIRLFNGIEVYVTVLSYGAGVDYCLFLIARYKEELDEGSTFEEATSNCLTKVGAAVTASACTVMCGIGMMWFAEFGKFKQAGLAITFGLFVVLCASLTFTPALLRLVGRWAFWPRIPHERVAATSGWLSHKGLLARMMDKNLVQQGWTRMGQLLLKHPGRIWGLSIALMLPFAIVGILCRDYLSYGLLSELPQNNASVVGAKAIQQHFPAGVAGPVTVLLKNPEVKFAGSDVVSSLTERLVDRKEHLDLADIRSSAMPLGLTVDLSELSLAERLTINRTSSEYYVSNVDGLDGHVTRLDLIFEDDPFSRGSIAQLEHLQRAVEMALLGQGLGVKFAPDAPLRIASLTADSPMAGAGISAGDEVIAVDARPVETQQGLQSALVAAVHQNSIKLTLRSPGAEAKTVDLAPPETLKNWSRTEVLALGSTASIRDLKRVTDRDQVRIDALVLAGVFAILVILLRKPAVSAYLIVSVFFSYLVTLGVTFTVFWYLNPDEFAGLDWKVPMFLFTILIAVGEDYNIFLMTRIEEEQRVHGMVEGVVAALRKTGSIISSCGIIMAGTFSSLLAGTLVGMHQLGFALAFGVLLDTFVVRPILVPAYLVLLYRGRFGVLGRWLGAPRLAEQVVPDTEHAPTLA